MVQLGIPLMDGDTGGQTVEDGEDLGEPAPVVGIQTGVDIDAQMVFNQLLGEKLLGVQGEKQVICLLKIGILLL